MQSTAFQSAFAGVVATAAALPAASVRVTSVSAAPSRARRSLLASVNVAYSVATTAAAAATVTAVLSTSGGAVTALLGATYPGVTATNPVVVSASAAPTAAPSLAAAPTTAAPTAASGLLGQAKALLSALLPAFLFLAVAIFVVGEIIKRVYNIPTWGQMCSELKLLCCPPATH